jgi:hypothetical protein
MHRRLHACAAMVAATIATIGTPLGAQQPPTSPAASSDPFAHSPWSVQQCMLGLTYGAPMKVAVAWGGGFVYEQPEGGADVCIFGAAKLGLGGARLSTGVGRSIGALGGGAAVSAGVLRTFGAPVNATPKRTYVGASLHFFPVLALGGEIGWYTRLGDDPPGASKRSMITWSAGFGF